MQQADDMALFMATRRGDQAAAASLYARFAARMAALARARLRGDIAGADDAVQTAFMQVLAADARSAGRVKDVAAYLCRAVCNAAANHARGEMRRRVREAAARAADPGAGGEADPIGKAVDGLPGEQRDVVLLRHVAGLTFDQIALCLDEPRGTVASRYRLALAALRRLLETGSRDGVERLTDREATHAG